VVVFFLVSCLKLDFIIVIELCVEHFREYSLSWHCCQKVTQEQ